MKESNTIAKREAVSKRLRFEVFKRDGFQCTYCGVSPEQAVLRVDHVIPVREGGETVPENLVTSCFDCNAGKGAVPLEQRKLRTGKATEADKEHADQIREWLALQRDIGQAKDEVLDDLMARWERSTGDRDDSMRPRLRNGLAEFGFERMVEAIEIVAGKGIGGYYRSQERAKYFHGVLRRWREEGLEPIRKKADPTPPNAALPVISVNGDDGGDPHRFDVEHLRRCLRAVQRVFDSAKQHPAQHPDHASIRQAAVSAFARAAWCSAEELEWYEDGSEIPPSSMYCIRGMVLSFTEQGAAVAMRMGFNPFREAWKDLTYQLESERPDAPDRSALRLQSLELQLWLDLRQFYDQRSTVLEVTFRCFPELKELVAHWEVE